MRFTVFLYKVIRKCSMFIARRSFFQVGRNVVFDPLTSTISYRTIIIGDNSYIGPNAFLSSSHSKIIIGNNVMFGPGVSVYGGNHIINIVGTPMNLVEKSCTHTDPDVIIGNDVWIGGGVHILPGVRVGRGAVVGAGSVVTKDIEAYSISAGNPCKKMKMRFTEEQIIEHERMINEKS